MPCGQRISTLLAAREIRDAPHFTGVLGGAGGRYILDELARGALGTMPACELTDIHVTMVAAWRAGNTGFARTLYNRSLPLLNFQAVFRWAMTKEVLKRRGVIEARACASGPGSTGRTRRSSASCWPKSATCWPTFRCRAKSGFR